MYGKMAWLMLLTGLIAARPVPEHRMRRVKPRSS